MVANVYMEDAPTVPLQSHVVSLRGGRIEVVGDTASVAVDTEPVNIGRSKACALVLDDPSVTKIHAEVRATPRGVRVVDLGSRNGTFIGETSIVEVYLTGSCEFRCGEKRLRFVPEPAREVQITAPERFGALLGRAPEMTQLFAKLQRYAPHSMSILIQGETGTGKELVARAIHDASPRRDKRFLPVNCAGVRDNLLETELFGYVRGAFTGADRNRDGMFVEADGGTLFFDEVGEMSSAMQVTLLRVLERGEVRPVGSARFRTVNVRTLFATHVDLRQAASDGRFRDDLYQRIADLTVEVPPLRKRLGDVPALIDDLLVQLGYPDLKVDEAGLAALRGRRWRGNVRELRRVIRRAIVESEGDRLMLERGAEETSGSAEPEGALELYDDAKRDFDRGFYTALYNRFDGNLSKIAKAAGKQRVTVRTTLRALGLHER